LTDLRRWGKNEIMDREQATAALKACESELKALGVVGASVYPAAQEVRQSLLQRFKFGEVIDAAFGKIA